MGLVVVLEEEINLPDAAMYSCKPAIFWSFLIFAAAALSGCFDLKAVHSYSISSVNDLSNFEQVAYSFKRHCEDRCLDDKIRLGEIRRSLDCPCNPYIKADSVTQAIYLRLKDYFMVLASLSDNKAITLGSDAFRSNLSNGNFAGIHVGYEQADAYSRITALLVKASTEEYRRTNLSDLITDSNQSVLILLNAFKFILDSNLAGETEVRKEKLYMIYSAANHLRRLKAEDKSRMAQDYYHQVAELNAIATHIKTYTNAITLIALAHQKLYDSKKNITARATTKELNLFSVQLDEMYVTLTHLE